MPLAVERRARRKLQGLDQDHVRFEHALAVLGLGGSCTTRTDRPHATDREVMGNPGRGQGCQHCGAVNGWILRDSIQTTRDYFWRVARTFFTLRHCSRGKRKK
jgi:hypothetical protein